MHWHYAIALPDPTGGARIETTTGAERDLDRAQARTMLLPMIEYIETTVAPKLRYETPMGELRKPSEHWVKQDSLEWLNVGGAMFTVYECSGHCGDSAVAWVKEAAQAIKDAGGNATVESVAPW